MCGICGFTGQVLDRSKTIKNMTEVITHRGPDSEGFYSDDFINMGFRRLSIIDVEEGHQPIYNEDKTLVLTFNGEIYNYRDLRAELIELGHTFYTETDSEVLIHAFEEWKCSIVFAVCSALLFTTPRISRFLLPVTFSALSLCIILLLTATLFTLLKSRVF